MKVANSPAGDHCISTSSMVVSDEDKNSATSATAIVLLQPNTQIKRPKIKTDHHV
jgi:hypothetical protein